MLFLLLGHLLQAAGVFYLCWLGAGSGKQQTTPSAGLHLTIAGTVLFCLLVAAAWSPRDLAPFVVTTLAIWMGALPLAAGSQTDCDFLESDSN